MTKNKLYLERLSIVGIKAAMFVSFAGGDRPAQDNAAYYATIAFKFGGSAANAIYVGYRFGMSSVRKQNEYKSAK